MWERLLAKLELLRLVDMPTEYVGSLDFTIKC